MASVTLQQEQERLALIVEQDVIIGLTITTTMKTAIMPMMEYHILNHTTDNDYGLINDL